MANWKIDTTHSDVQFKVKHLVISTVTGTFKTFDARITGADDQWQNGKIYFEADAASLDTGVEQRDNHLRSDDFFNSGSFPKITFESTSLKAIDADKFELTGDLTIRDVTKPVTLQVEFGGIMTDFYGQTKAGFEVSGKINRKEFGLKWDAVTEAGGVVVGDEVKIAANVQFVKEA